MNHKQKQIFALYELITRKYDEVFEAMWDAPHSQWPSFDTRIKRARKRQQAAFKRWIQSTREGQKPRKTRQPF